MSGRLTLREMSALIDAAEEVLAGDVAGAFGIDDEDEAERLESAMRSGCDKLKARTGGRVIR